MRLIKYILSGSILGATLLAPLSAGAVGGMMTDTSASFCTRITAMSTMMTQRLSDLESKRMAKHDEIKGMLQKRHDDQSARVAARRAEAQTKFEQNVADLNDEATTPAEQQALSDFKAAVKAAIDTRKAAVDAAQQTFRTGVSSLVTTRQTSVKSAVTTFKTAVATALQKAKTDCAAGVDPTTVKQALMISMMTAKTQLQTTLQSLDKNGPEIEALAKTRNEAIRTANQAFKAALEQARANLKAAMPDA